MASHKFEVFVPIVPVPKSYRSVSGRMIISQHCREFQRECVRFLEKHQETTLDGYLWAEYTFYLLRPPTNKNMRYPARKPDHDNLVKSMQDCLERSGIIKNDSRIVKCDTRKVFCSGEGSNGICQPGTLIRLGELD